MALNAGQAEAPWLRTLALWGQAETSEDAEQAEALRATVRHQIAALTAGFEGSARRCFLRYPERRCMLEDVPETPASHQEEHP